MGVMTVAFIALALLALALVLVLRAPPWPAPDRRARGAPWRPRRRAPRGAAPPLPAASTSDDEWDDDLGWVDTPSDREPITAHRGEGAPRPTGTRRAGR